MKTVQDVKAANDDFSGLGRRSRSGDLIWDLLTTRIRMPASAPLLLDRPALYRDLESSLQPGCTTLVEAPAGYGKTQSLAAVLRTRQPSEVAWLTLDPRDNHPGRLLSLLTIALRQEGRFDREALDSSQHQDVLSLMLKDWELKPGTAQDVPVLPRYLVLDDAHCISHHFTASLVSQLVNELPKTLALVLISRTHLSLATHSYTLAGHLQRFDAASLALSAEETAELLTGGLQDHQLSPTAVEHLHHVTEGWLTPLQLYRQALQKASSTPHPIVENPDVGRFFRNGLLGNCSYEHQQSLLQMAELDVVNDALFNAVAVGSNGAMLTPSAAAEAGLPIWSVPGREHWYRVNPLFRDWLTASGSAGSYDRALRASRWFEYRGDRSEALSYALRAQDTERALNIAASGSEALLVNQDTGALLRWRQRLPGEFFHSSPRLRIVYGWVHAIGGQFSRAEQLIAPISAREASQMGGRLSTLQAFILRGRGEVSEALQKADSATYDSNMSDHARLMALLIRSSALCARLRFAEARDANRRAARLARESGDAGCEMLAVYDHARIELGKGKLKQAEALLRSGLEVARHVPHQPPRVGESRLQLSLALALWHRGRRSEAETWLLRSARYAEQCQDLGLLLNMALRALLAKSRGETEVAFSWIGQAERTMQLWQVDDAVYRPVLEALKASCWLATGHLEHVGIALQKIWPDNEKNPPIPELFPMLPGLLDTLKIRLHLALDDSRSAQALLDDFQCLADPATGTRPLGHTIYGMILQARIHQATGKPDRALVTLRAALQAAAEERYLSPFLEMAEELDTLLPPILATASTGEFYSDLRDIFEVTRRQESTPELAETVSERERGVLELIAVGLSNQDIADRLHISLHTVKTHARRINAKLGVRSRTQAIVRAREHGLL